MRSIDVAATVCVAAVLSSCGIRFRPANLADVVPLGVKTELVDHDGRAALRVVEDHDAPLREGLAIVPDVEFENGVIQVDVAGAPAPRAAADARGFVGVAFRIQRAAVVDGTSAPPAAERFEVIYLRPTNGRAPDQLRRNHSTQYASWPEYPWDRLRTEMPGKYESYVDLVPDRWTRMKIHVDGTHAELFIDDAEQPCLIVDDLKLGETRGAIGFWIGSGTVAHFANLTVAPAQES